MSSRRRLVSRAAAGSPSSPSTSRANPVQATPLPPYEPLSCPLTANGKRALAEISANHDFKKFKKQLDGAINHITLSAAESTDRLYDAKDQLRRLAEKRDAAEGYPEKGEVEERAEQRAENLEEKVGQLIVQAEEALRGLIDIRQEFEQQNLIIEEVVEKCSIESRAPETTKNPGTRQRRRRVLEDDDDEDEDGDFEDRNEDVEMEADNDAVAASQPTILSPAELLKQAKEKFTTAYNSKSMRARYADTNEYRHFKRVLHDALHPPGPDAPPVPHASTWFPSDTTPARRRMRHDEDDNEDDIVIAGAVSSLKCPLTLQTFKEPYSNKVCKHTFEKSAILDMHRLSAVAFADPSQGRKAKGTSLVKRLKCPEQGCDAMIALEDFYDDQIILRQVQRAAMQAAAEAEEDQLARSDYETPVGIKGSREAGMESARTARSMTARSMTARSMTARSMTARSMTARSMTARSMTAVDDEHDGDDGSDGVSGEDEAEDSDE